MRLRYDTELYCYCSCTTHSSIFVRCQVTNPFHSNGTCEVITDWVKWGRVGRCVRELAVPVDLDHMCDGSFENPPPYTKGEQRDNSDLGDSSRNM